MGPGNEHGQGTNWGARTAEQLSHLGNYTSTHATGCYHLHRHHLPSLLCLKSFYCPKDSERVSFVACSMAAKRSAYCDNEKQQIVCTAWRYTHCATRCNMLRLNTESGMCNFQYYTATSHRPSRMAVNGVPSSGCNLISFNATFLPVSLTVTQQNMHYTTAETQQVT